MTAGAEKLSNENRGMASEGCPVIKRTDNLVKVASSLRPLPAEVTGGTKPMCSSGRPTAGMINLLLQS